MYVFVVYVNMCDTHVYLYVSAPTRYAIAIDGMKCAIAGLLYNTLCIVQLPILLTLRTNTLYPILKPSIYPCLTRF